VIETKEQRAMIAQNGIFVKFKGVWEGAGGGASETCFFQQFWVK